MNSAVSHLPIQPGVEVSTPLSCIRIDTYANAKLNALDWLHNAPSLLAPKRSLFLICPSEAASQEEAAIWIWRSAIQESEVLRSAANKNSTSEQSLQVIRGFWEETKAPKESKSALTPHLLSNVSYAFANVTKHLILGSPQPLGEINNFRSIPQTLNNYSCEKCSDPECEHKLFGFLKTQQPIALD